MKVSVSFLKSKYDLEETINKIMMTDADYIHVDIMDGKFVKNTTLQYEDLKNYLYGKKLDVHLMVDNPKEFIMDYKNLNPEFITIHKEINHDLYELIDLIHSFGIKAGISIKPDTKVTEIEKYLNVVDNVLIMSVEPGLGGQKFNESSIDKINLLNKLRRYKGYTYEISIDGGINDITIDKVRGVDFVVSGSFICKSDDYQLSLNKLR